MPQQITKLGEGKSKEETKNSIEPVVKFINYNYATTLEDQFKSKHDLFVHYLNQRKNSLAQAQKQMSSLIQKTEEKVSLMTL